MANKELNHIYRVESIQQRNTNIANNLLANGWELLAIEEIGNLSMDGVPEKHISMLIGASKSVFERYNLEHATPKSEYDSLF